MPADTIDKSNLKKLITFTVDMICEKSSLFVKDALMNGY